MTRKQKHLLARIVIAAILFFAGSLFYLPEYMEAGIFLICYIVVGWDIVWKAITNILHGQVFDENFLMTIATIGALVLGEHSEGVAVMLFYQVGEWFQSYAVSKSRKSIASLMDIRPDYANVQRNGELIQVDPDEVQIGDTIIVKPGERIPLDGTILKGSSALDTSALTGESMPREVEPGMEVISGCINQTGILTICTTKEFGESTVAKILDLVENASDKKGRTENFITRFARYYTPAVVFAALALAILPPFITGQAFSIWIYRALTFLVISCPCALVISIPLSFFGGIGGASKIGVLVKGSNYLESLAHAEYVVFDKTGTLTKGELTISKIYNYSSLNENEIIKLVASIENKSEHPIARAIINEAKNRKIELEEILEFKAIPGYGVSATINEKKYLIGNKKLMLENNITMLQEQNELELVSDGNSILFIAENQNLIALIGVKDVLKKESKDIVKKLQERNIEVVMLTGDNEKTANAIAEQIGVNKVIANVLPRQKAEEIKKLKEKGLVMMCGDGINDSVSLVTADIGVSVSSGTDIAMDSSNVVLINDNLKKIEDLLSISQKTIRNIKQNLFWAFFYNICMIPIACGVLEPLGVVMNPMIAAFAMTISSLTVILNALRLKR